MLAERWRAGLGSGTGCHQNCSLAARGFVPMRWYLRSWDGAKVEAGVCLLWVCSFSLQPADRPGLRWCSGRAGAVTLCATGQLEDPGIGDIPHQSVDQPNSGACQGGEEQGTGLCQHLGLPALRAGSLARHVPAAGAGGADEPWAEPIKRFEKSFAEAGGLGAAGPPW